MGRTNVKIRKLWRKTAWTALKKERDAVEESYSNLERADPELCIRLLQFPSVHNFQGIRKKIEMSNEEWIKEFLIQDGLSQLFVTLERLSETSHQSKETDLLRQRELIQCVMCLKAIMNSPIGFDFVISHKDCKGMLSKTLANTNSTVKMTVFELLAAMCMYSQDGRNSALSTMEKHKSDFYQRYRFSMLINELRTTKNVSYKTSILCFINAVLIKTTPLQDRAHLRDEFVGLQLLDILSELRDSWSEDLLRQIDVFRELQQSDEDEFYAQTGQHDFNINDPRDVFFTLFRKVSNTPQANYLLTVLHCLMELNPKDPVSDIAWQVMEKTAQRVVCIKNEEDGKKLLKIPKQNCPEDIENGRLGMDAVDGHAPVSSPPPYLLCNDGLTPKETQSSLQTSPPPPPPPVMGGSEKEEAEHGVPKPSKSLRKVNWQKFSKEIIINNKKGSVWSFLEKAELNAEPDYRVLEESFAQKTISKQTEETVHTSKVTKISFVESRLSMNVEIFLKQFNTSNEEIVKALEDGNERILTAEKLKRMKKYLPSETDIDLIEGFPGNKSSLANVDRYFLLLSRVPFYNLRIEAEIAKTSFEEEMHDLNLKVQTVEQACKEILTSVKLKSLLLLVLKAGNFMNYGSAIGGAYGFKLSSLLKLSDTRSNKPSTTLLHCIVDMIDSQHRDLSDLPETMESVVECKAISLSQLMDDIEKLTASLKQIEEQVNDASNDIKVQYKKFFESVNQQTSTLHDKLEDINDFSKHLAKFFAEDTKQFKLDDCFTTLADFFEQFKSARKANKQLKTKQENREKRDQIEKEQKKQGASKTSNFHPQQNLVETLLKGIGDCKRIRKT